MPITIRPFVRFLVRHAKKLNYNGTIIVHSWNPNGATWIAQTLADHGYKVLVEQFEIL